MEMTGERFMPKMRGIIELEHLNRYYFVVNQISLQDKIVVDLASGEGYGSDILSNYAEKVIGVDISNEAVEHAIGAYKKNNLEFKQGDASNIPLPNNFADVFVSFETIEHHDKHEQMLMEIKRVLKPDGILIMSSPDKYYYTDLPDFHNPYHVKELYYKEFKTLISRYFKFNIYYCQNNFSGSILTTDEENTENIKPILTDKSANTFEFSPLYNLVFSTNNNSIKPKFPHFFYGDFNYILTNDDIEIAKIEVFDSLEYRIGKKILKYFKFLRKFLK